MTKEEVKALVDEDITTNGTGQITGAILNNVLNETVDAITKENVELGNCDNTSDANKPVSTAQQTALNLKANIASPTFTGNPQAPTKSQADNSTSLATTAYVDTGLATKQNELPYVAENADNKETTMTGNEVSNIFYLTAKAIYDWATNLFISKNVAITGATKTKITYDANGLVTAGTDATTADIADSSNKRYVTDANLTVIGNTSGTNTGDNAANTTSNTYADGKVENAINSGTTDKAPSEDAVFDALSNKADKLIGQSFTSGPVTETATNIYSIDTSLSAINFQTLNTNTTARYLTIQNISGLNIISISSPGALTFNGASIVTVPAINGAIATLIFDGTAGTDIKVIFSIPTNVVKLLAATTATTFEVPAGYIIENIAIENTTGNAVTGGLKIGTTLGAADIVAAQTVGANALLVVPAADVLLQIFSTSVSQTVFIDAVTAFNSASLNIAISLKKVL